MTQGLYRSQHIPCALTSKRADMPKMLTHPSNSKLSNTVALRTNESLQSSWMRSSEAHTYSLVLGELVLHSYTQMNLNRFTERMVLSWVKPPFWCVVELNNVFFTSCACNKQLAIVRCERMRPERLVPTDSSSHPSSCFNKYDFAWSTGLIDGR